MEEDDSLDLMEVGLLGGYCVENAIGPLLLAVFGYRSPRGDRIPFRPPRFWWHIWSRGPSRCRQELSGGSCLVNLGGIFRSDNPYDYPVFTPGEY